MLAQYPCDLHVHSHFSPDAEAEPDELFRRAKERGITTLVLTDHNTTRHLDVARTAAQKYGLATLEGVEISTRGKTQGVHILGYATRFDRDILEAGLAPTIAALNDRAQTMIELLRTRGIVDLDFATIASRQHGAYVGRHEIARAIAVAKQIDYFEAFQFIDWEHGSAFVPYPAGTITPEDAIALVHRASGFSVLAHAGDQMIKKGVREGTRVIRELVAQLAKSGLGGIERNHIDHTKNPEAMALVDELATIYHLLPTGGSDWHTKLFTGHYDLGDWGCGETVVESIKEKVRG